jgi:hypothetical protein
MRAPLILALVAALCGAAGGGAADKSDGSAEAERRQVEALLDELDAADFGAREAAAAALVRIGPNVLEPLRKRLDRPHTPEFRSRAKQVTDGVAQTWRYWSPEGGPIAGGFQATLAPASAVVAGAATFKAGAPIVFKLEIRNVCPEPRQFVDVRGIDLDLGGAGGPVVTEFGTARAVLRAAAGGPLPADGRALLYDTGEPRTIQFKTGGNVMVRIPLADAVELKAGEYEIRVVYYAKTKGLVKEAAEDLESNVVRFKIE